ncbi:MAG: NAD(+) diphosphatase [Lachnospiraceae bacterium]|nr:NAD(+) diphosphatase [Lachnospiraceae bacterium]
MLQDIAPCQLHNEYTPDAPQPDDLVFVFSEKGGKALLRVFDETGRLIDRPISDDYPAAPKLVFPRVLDYTRHAPERLPMLRFLFRIDETAVFLDIGEGAPVLAGFTWLSTRLFRRGLPKAYSFAGATAWHLRCWYLSSRFCGKCGSACVPDKKERAMRCPSCGNTIYPRINPAVIIGVTDGDRIILSRYADRHQSSVYNAYSRAYKGQSLIAGYCEIGEAIEDTVRREVMEEVGLRVKNISYYKSQPWGFDCALLCGFYCSVEGDTTIRLDQNELSEAVWVHRSEIGEIPGTASLTNEMIRFFQSDSFSLPSGGLPGTKQEPAVPIRTDPTP